MADEATVTEEALSREDVIEFYGDNLPPDSVLDDYPEADPKTDVESEPEPEEKKEPEEVEVKPDPKETEVKPEIEKDETKEEVKPEPEEEADVLSKSGKYTIPYEKLTEARESAKTAEAATIAAQAKVDALEAKIHELSNPGNDKDSPDENKELSDSDLEELQEDYPAAVKTIEALKGTVDQMKKAQEEQATQNTNNIATAHFDAIKTAHEDYQEALGSKEFSDWVDSQSSIMKDAYLAVYKQGTAKQVVEMLTAFKDGTKPEATTKPEDDSTGKIDKAAVAAKIKAAEEKEQIPNSLSEVPGVTGDTDPVEMLQNAANSGKAVDDMFAGKTHDQIEASVNKLLK